MKFNKQVIIILVLISLLLSALGAVFYFYKQNEITVKENNKVKTIFVAAKDIKINHKITKKDLKAVTIAKKYILTKPLLNKEIVGKYAVTNIYKNDTITKKKISAKVVQLKKKKSIIDEFKFNSYNMQFKLFQNPNFSLKKGDIINIISVYPKENTKSKSAKRAVQYVAKQIKVIGFLQEGKESSKVITIKTVDVYNKKTKKTTKKKIEVKADELVLDIQSKVLLQLINDYNRGNQLWMVKTKEEKIVKKVAKKIEPKEEKKVKIIKNNKKSTTHKKFKKVRKDILYTPKNRVNHIKATIHYGDKKEPAIIKKKTIKVKAKNYCTSKKKFLITLSRRTYLRSGPSIKNKAIKVLKRYYIIPFTKKVNKDWYQTCDGYYVHRLEAREISYKEVQKRLRKKL